MDPAIPELNEEESSGAGDLFPGRTVSASVVSSGRNESVPCPGRLTSFLSGSTPGTTRECD